MTGGIAEAFYREIPAEIRNRAYSLLDVGLKNTIRLFARKYCPDFPRISSLEAPVLARKTQRATASAPRLASL